MQKILSAKQIQEFYIDVFVSDQIRDFTSMVNTEDYRKTVLDIGGGCGFFAKELANRTDSMVKVIDIDPVSVEKCRSLRIEAELGDAANPNVKGNYDIVCFNLVLHHLVAATENNTQSLQTTALEVWKNKIQFIFVNEYIYESYFGEVSGWLIYSITKNKFLSKLAKVVSKFIPSLRANTFGTGVRFRSQKEWENLFYMAGYDVESYRANNNEHVSLPLRMLFIKHIHRMSFLLTPRSGALNNIA